MLLYIFSHYCCEGSPWSRQLLQKEAFSWGPCLQFQGLWSLWRAGLAARSHSSSSWELHPDHTQPQQQCLGAPSWSQASRGGWGGTLGLKRAFKTSKPKSRHTPPPTKATPPNPTQTFHRLGRDQTFKYMRVWGPFLFTSPYCIILLSPSLIAGILSLYCYVPVSFLFLLLHFCVCVLFFVFFETGLSTYSWLS